MKDSGESQNWYSCFPLADAKNDLNAVDDGLN